MNVTSATRASPAPAASRHTRTHTRGRSVGVHCDVKHSQLNLIYHAAWPCEVPGCKRTFAVRSNAKRHLRTHGVFPPQDQSESASTPYTVSFDPPKVSADIPHQLSEQPITIRWVPQSLAMRRNAEALLAHSESGLLADAPISLPAVTPSSMSFPPGDGSEERISLATGSHSYHPSQVGSLAG